MSLTSIAVLMNVVGIGALTAAAAAFIFYSRDNGSRGLRLLSRQGLGLLSVLTAGALLAGGGQYKLVRLLADGASQTSLASAVSPRLAGVLVAGFVLLAVGAALLLRRGDEDRSPALEERPTAASGFGSLTLVAAAVIAGLVGLNLYQYVTRPPVPSDQQVIDRFHELFYDASANTWMGVECGQNPSDAWIHQEIIFDVKPDFIVETGTNKGASAAFWAMVLQQVNPEGRVITIDIVDMADDARKIPIVQQKVDFLIGSSTDPKLVAEVGKRVQGRKVLVILDSDHSRDHVLNELKAYSPLVSLGSYLIVQDTNINGHPVRKDFGPGPMEAVEAFLAQNDQFEPDFRREHLLFTMHPKGYLKRVK